MEIKELEELFRKEKTNELAWEGQCHDCGKEITVVAHHHGESIEVKHGVVYNPEIHGKKEFFVKCEDCYSKDSVLKNYMPTEVYSRIVGYLRPTNNWNGGKKQEFEMRQPFEINT